MVGLVMLMICSQVVLLPYASVAVHVLVITFTYCALHCDTTSLSMNVMVTLEQASEADGLGTEVPGVVD